MRQLILSAHSRQCCPSILLTRTAFLACLVGVPLLPAATALLATGADLSTLAVAGAALLSVHVSLLTCLADAPLLPAELDLCARIIAGVALLSAGVARLASCKPPSSTLLKENSPY